MNAGFLLPTCNTRPALLPAGMLMHEMWSARAGPEHGQTRLAEAGPAAAMRCSPPGRRPLRSACTARHLVTTVFLFLPGWLQPCTLKRLFEQIPCRHQLQLGRTAVGERKLYILLPINKARVDYGSYKLSAGGHNSDKHPDLEGRSACSACEVTVQK